MQTCETTKELTTTTAEGDHSDSKSGIEVRILCAVHLCASAKGGEM